MLIGKLENASASYIDPTAKAMRASADSASQGKADVTSIPEQPQAEDKPNTAAELLESNGVYKLDISEEGQALAAMEKKTLADNKGVALVVSGKGDDMTISVLKDGEITNVVNVNEMRTKNDGPLIRIDRFNRCEVDSLANNMFTIERSIVSAFEAAKAGCGLCGTLEELGLALNAYGHKQREDIAKGVDPYLQSLSDRLDMMDKSHPVVQRIRSMLDTTMRGKEIDVWGDKFQGIARSILKLCQTSIGQSPEKEETKPEDLFNDKFALYGYMQKLARWQAEQDADLIEEMTGEGDGKKENHGVGEVLRNTSLEDGLQAINGNAYHWQRSYYRGDMTALTEEQLAEEKEINEKALSYAAGYNWNVICQKFLKENPDMAEMLSKNGDPYVTSWNRA